MDLKLVLKECTTNFPTAFVFVLELSLTDYDSETTEREENLTDSNQDNSECTTPTASHDNIAAELAYDQPSDAQDIVPEPPPKHTHVDTVARKISTASSIGSNQSDGGSIAHERSGSTESQNGERKPAKPTRKISRFLVSPVIDRGENVPEEKAVISEPEKPPDKPPERPDRPPERPERPPERPDRPPEKTERPPEKPDREPQLNGLPEKEPAPQPTVPIQYSVQTQSQTSQTVTEQRPLEVMQERPPERPPEAPMTSMPMPMPVTSMSMPINQTLLQPNLTTPLQIATDTPLLGMSQVGTPMGTDLGLNVLGQGFPLSTQQTLTPTPAVSDALSNAENIQRMLLKQNIINQQQNLSGPNLLGLLNQPSFPQPDLGLHTTILNNAQPAAAMGARLPPQYPQYYQPMLATANDFIAQQQALQSSVNLAGQQMSPAFGLGFGLASQLPMAPPLHLQHQNIALNQNLMGQNLGQNLGLASQNLGLGGQNLIGGQNLSLGGQALGLGGQTLGLGGQTLGLGGQTLGLVGQNLGQLVAQRAVHHALTRRPIEVDMSMTNVNSTGSSQPSTPNKSHSYSEYMLSLQHKLASISNSGPVSPQSPLEYSPALSPTHRQMASLSHMHKSEGVEAEKARHVAQLAELDHELSKISLHYKHPPPKDVFIEHNADEHGMMSETINDAAVTTYEASEVVGGVGVGVGGGAGGAGRFVVARAAPCHGYALCRLLADQHSAKELVSQRHGYSDVDAEAEAEGDADAEGEGADVEGADADAEGAECETYVVTEARAATYLVADALAGTTYTLLHPGRQIQRSSCTSSSASGTEDGGGSCLVVDAARGLTCAVLDHALRLHHDCDQHFRPFLDDKYAYRHTLEPGVSAVPASEELSRWRVDADGWREGALLQGAAVGGAGGAGGAAGAPRAHTLAAAGLTADVLVDDKITDKVLCRQVVLLSVRPALL